MGIIAAGEHVLAMLHTLESCPPCLEPDELNLAVDKLKQAEFRGNCKCMGMLAGCCMLFQLCLTLNKRLPSHEEVRLYMLRKCFEHRDRYDRNKTINIYLYSQCFAALDTQSRDKCGKGRRPEVGNCQNAAIAEHEGQPCRGETRSQVDVEACTPHGCLTADITILKLQAGFASVRQVSLIKRCAHVAQDS